MQVIIAWLTSATGIVTIIAVALCTCIFIVLKKVVKKFVNKSNNAVTVLLGLLKYIAIFICVIIVLDINGVNISKLIAGLGIASIVIGFALQDALKDIIMAIHILIDGFYKIGDVIKYAEVEGTVVDFTMHSTKIKELETGAIFSISNRDIEQVIKSSGVCDILVPMPYEEDPREMHELMQRIAEQFESVDHVIMGEFVGTQDFNESSISYRLRFRCNPVHKPQARRDCMFIIQKCLEEAGKRIPYNQLDIHQKD